MVLRQPIYVYVELLPSDFFVECLFNKQIVFSRRCTQKTSYWLATE